MIDHKKDRLHESNQLNIYNICIKICMHIICTYVCIHIFCSVLKMYPCTHNYILIDHKNDRLHKSIIGIYIFIYTCKDVYMFTYMYAYCICMYIYIYIYYS